MNDIVRTIQISGFDPEGEPEIQIMKNGELQVVFNFMPPSDFPDPENLGAYANFDRDMEAAIGRPVAWEDRELFLIQSPAIDTVVRVREFLMRFREAEKSKRQSMPLPPAQVRSVLSGHLRELDEQLVRFGFELKSERAHSRSEHPYHYFFERKINGGWQRISFYVSDLGHSCSLVVQIRLDAVEEIANRFYWYLRSDAEMATSCTVSTPIGWFFKPATSVHDFNTKTAAQISSVFGDLAPLVPEKVVPFLDQCKDVRSLEMYVNAQTSPEFNIATNVPDRAYSSVILARLANSPHFDDLVRATEATPGIVHAQRSERKRWDDLVAYLREIRP